MNRVSLRPPIVTTAPPPASAPRPASVRIPILALALFLAMPESPGWAQAIEAGTAERESVRNEPRPEYDPIGVNARQLWYAIGETLGQPRRPQSMYLMPKLASFEIRPKLELETVYDDNIFRENANESDDVIFITNPEIEIESDWVNHSVALKLSSEYARHRDFNSEDYFDYRAAFENRLDIGLFTTLRSSVFVERETESRSSLDSLRASPSPARQLNYGFESTLEYDSDVGLLRTRLSGRRADWRDTGDIDNDTRDEDTLELVQRVGYTVSPGTTLFIEPAVGTDQFVLGTDRSGLDKDSKSYRARAGVTWDASGVTFVEVGVGWERELFESPSLKDIGGLSYEGRVLWNPTDLMTLDLQFGREIGETTASTQSGRVIDMVELSVDYAPLHNVIFDGLVGFEHDEFRGIGRVDKNFAGALGVKYLINRFFFARLNYEFDERESDSPTSNFTNNRITLSLGSQL